MIVIACLAVLSLVVAFVLRWKAGVGLWVLYRDKGSRQDMIVSRSHRMRGKPDFIERSREGITPVEYKSTKGSISRPLSHHVMQLLAYCFLLEDVLGQNRVRKGRVVYDQASFDVPYEAKERVQVARLLTRMRLIRPGSAKRSHDQIGKCRSCSFRDACDQRLH